MNTGLNSGLLIIGVTSTILFESEVSTTELILLDLRDGCDFTFPVSEEQASVIANYLGSKDGSAGEDHIEGVVAVTPEAQDFANNIGLGEVGVGKVDSSGEVEVTPQF
jgi:hypothetical protein